MGGGKDMAAMPDIAAVLTVAVFTAFKGSQAEKMIVLVGYFL